MKNKIIIFFNKINPGFECLFDGGYSFKFRIINLFMKDGLRIVLSQMLLLASNLETYNDMVGLPNYINHSRTKLENLVSNLTEGVK